MSAHRHRAIKNETQMRGFTGCAAPYNCNPASHGSALYVDHCRCGATRRTNVNQGFHESAGWVVACEDRACQCACHRA